MKCKDCNGKGYVYLVGQMPLENDRLNCSSCNGTGEKQDQEAYLINGDMDEYYCMFYECSLCRNEGLMSDFKYCPYCGVKIKD